MGRGRLRHPRVQLSAAAQGLRGAAEAAGPGCTVPGAVGKAAGALQVSVPWVFLQSSRVGSTAGSPGHRKTRLSHGTSTPPAGGRRAAGGVPALTSAVEDAQGHQGTHHQQEQEQQPPLQEALALLPCQAGSVHHSHWAFCLPHRQALDKKCTAEWPQARVGRGGGSCWLVLWGHPVPVSPSKARAPVLVAWSSGLLY